MRRSRNFGGSFLSAFAVLTIVLGPGEAQTADTTQASTEPTSKQESEFYEEAVDWCPWPDFVNIICFPEAGYAYINFIKFSVEENGSYFGDFPVLCTIPDLDKLPASGWIYDPKTGYSCWISVEVGNGKLDLDNYGLIPTAARQLKQSLEASPSKFVPIWDHKEKAFPDRLKVFLEELGPKLSQGSLEVTKYVYVPPVWRKTPLHSSVKRMSVEAWNKQVLDEKR